MSKEKKNKLLQVSELVKRQDERQAELSNLVAMSMQTGYELGKQAAVIKETHNEQ